VQLSGEVQSPTVSPVHPLLDSLRKCVMPSTSENKQLQRELVPFALPACTRLHRDVEYHDVMLQKELEIERLKKEIEALRIVVPMLQDKETTLAHTYSAPQNSESQSAPPTGTTREVILLQSRMARRHKFDLEKIHESLMVSCLHPVRRIEPSLACSIRLIKQLASGLGPENR